MTEPTFPDGPPVPLLVEGLLDRETLARLFTDLAAQARVFSIREKNDPKAQTDEGALTLTAALERLLSGANGRVQIRYAYAGDEWIDTILATSAGYRVVRCQAS